MLKALERIESKERIKDLSKNRRSRYDIYGTANGKESKLATAYSKCIAWSIALLLRASYQDITIR